MSSESTPPVTLSKSREVRVRADVLFALVAAAVAVAVAWVNVSAKAAEIGPMRVKLEQHDLALAKLEVMANDIAWIKAELARQRREGNAK